MGSVLSLFENKDTIVKEFQKVMGERLLTQQQDFDREVRIGHESASSVANTVRRSLYLSC